MATVLIVDDTPLVLRVLRRVVENAGHECVSVSSAKEAIEELGKRSYDLAIVDLVMPEMDGVELIEWIRRELQAPGLSQCPRSETFSLRRARSQTARASRNHLGSRT